MSKVVVAMEDGSFAEGMLKEPKDTHVGRFCEGQAVDDWVDQRIGTFAVGQAAQDRALVVGSFAEGMRRDERDGTPPGARWRIAGGRTDVRMRTHEA